MEITLELIVALITGFAIGCFITTLISISLYSSQQKKLESNVQNRHTIINSIGTMCANIENAFSAHKIGTMKNDTLREVVVAKLNLINTALQGNVDILDPFYVKNIERFINDQNKFLLEGTEAIEDVTKIDTKKSKKPGSLKTDESDTEKEVSIEVLDPQEQQGEADEQVSVEVDLVSEEIEIPAKTLAEEDESKQDDSSEVQIEKDSDEKKELLSSFESEATASISIDKVKELIESPTKSTPTDTIEEEIPKQTEEVYIEPEKEYIEPEKEYIEPEKEYIEPEKEYIEPEKGYIEPEKGYIEPEKEFIEPEKGYIEPADDEHQDESPDVVTFEKAAESQPERSITIEEYPPQEEQKVGKKDDSQKPEEGGADEQKPGEEAFGQKPGVISQASFPLFESEETTATGEFDLTSVDLQTSQAEYEEESAFEVESARFDGTFPALSSDDDEDEEEPIKGTPVFDSSFDVEATQIYNVEDLLKNSKVESESIKSTQSIESLGKEEKLSEQSAEESMLNEEAIEVNIQNKRKPRKHTKKQNTKESQGDSLITGNDVMDKMDNFFGFDSE